MNKDAYPAGEVLTSTALTVPPDSDRGSWEAGRAAGLKWATDEARRGYRHPLNIEAPHKTRLLVGHARQAFGGLTQGRRHPFIRGFVAGVAEFWSSRTDV
jgi:hypothetical protein